MGTFRRYVEAGNLAFAGAIMTGQQAERYQLWNKQASKRDGRWHASSLLVPSEDYCAREHILDLSYIRQEKVWPEYILPILKYGWAIHEGEQEILTYQTPNDIIDSVRQLYAVDIPDTIPEEEEDRRLRKMAWSLIQQQNQGLAFEVEKAHWREEYNLAFTPDGLVRNDGIKMVWEIKGYKHDVFENILNGNPMEEPGYAKAVYQANFYVALLRKESRFYDLNHFCIYIIDKSNSRYLLRLHAYNPTMAIPYISRAEELMDWKALNGQGIEKLPERICGSIDDERAKNCPLRAACFSSSREEREQWRKAA